VFCSPRRHLRPYQCSDGLKVWHKQQAVIEVRRSAADIKSSTVLPPDRQLAEQTVLHLALPSGRLLDLSFPNRT